MSDKSESYESDFIDDEGAPDEFEESGSEGEELTGKKKKLKHKKTLKKKKKQKLGANIFVEEEASEDEEEDEESGDDEMFEHERKLAQIERKKWEDTYKRRKTTGPGFLNLEGEQDVDEYFKEKARMEEAGEENELSLLPTASDPRLYAVGCKPGSERDACVLIMKKYFDCLGTPQEFQIFSVNAIDKTEGFIYIEAFNNKHVYLAIQNIGICNSRKVTLVNFNDRTQIFEYDPTKNIEIKEGQWVRVKKGLYGGDLGQVEFVDESRNRALIKLVPRIPPAGEAVDEEEEKGELIKGKFGYFRKVKTPKIKPPQRLFQENEYQDISSSRDHETGMTFTVYKGQKFYQGLLYKYFPYKNLATTSINPSYEELKFFTGGETADTTLLNTLIDQTGIKTKKFFKGDKVRVIRGELINLEAEIIKINENTVTVRPLNTEFAEPIEILPSDCVKAFKKGDYVRVVEGKNSGKEGFVINIEDSTATIICDGLQNQIQVFVNDLVFCNESTRNIQIKSDRQKELDQYNKFDLIKLNDHKTVGIVLAVTGNSIKILDNFGNIQNINHYLIETKLNTKSYMSRNDKGQTFRVGDSARILQGKYKGSTGIIKHIYNDLLFLYNTDFTATYGCVIEKANNCYLLSSQAFSNVKPVSKGGKDPLLGQKCCIIQGPWKGYQGLCRDVAEKTVRLEITAKCRMLDVKKEWVKPMSELANYNEPVEGRTLEPKTPMINKFPQSPYFVSSPGFENSPAWGGFESPAYDAHLK